MQEIEKLRILQSQREAFRNRSKVVERERKTEEHTETVCPECESRQLVHDYERAELVCQNCGLVIDDDFIDRGPEWRAFDHDQRMKRSRVGAPMTFTIHDKGLSTMIDWRNRDSYGRAISSKNRAQLYRLRKWQRRIRVSNATERNLAFALSELDRMASALGLPRNVRETAAVVYRDAVDKNLIRGRRIEGVAAAALYAACRQCSVPRTLDEIAEVSRVSQEGDRPDLPVHLARARPQAPADVADRLRAALLLGPHPEGRGPEPGRRDPAPGGGTRADERQGPDRRRSGRHLHLVDPRRGAAHPA